MYHSNHRPPLEMAPNPPNEYHEIGISPGPSKQLYSPITPKPRHMQNCCNQEINSYTCDRDCRTAPDLSNIYADVCESPRGPGKNRCANNRKSDECYIMEDDIYHAIDHYEEVTYQM